MNAIKNISYLNKNMIVMNTPLYDLNDIKSWKAFINTYNEKYEIKNEIMLYIDLLKISNATKEKNEKGFITYLNDVDRVCVDNIIEILFNTQRKSKKGRMLSEPYTKYKDIIFNSKYAKKLNDVLKNKQLDSCDFLLLINEYIKNIRENDTFFYILSIIISLNIVKTMPNDDYNNKIMNSIYKELCSVFTSNMMIYNFGLLMCDDFIEFINSSML